MSITENPQPANLHSAFLSHDIDEDYIKTRTSSSYDNESNKELTLGSVDDSRSLSSAANSDTSQNDTESVQNNSEVPQSSNNINDNFDNSSLDHEKNANVLNTPDDSSSSDMHNVSNGQSISIINVHDNNIANETKKVENKLMNNDKEQITSENSINPSQIANNDKAESHEKPATEKLDSQLSQPIQRPPQQIRHQIPQAQPQMQPQYQQPPIYNIGVMKQGIIYYQQPPQQNYVMIKQEPNPNVRFGDNLSQNINSLLPRSASVTSIRSTVPITHSAPPINDQSIGFQQQQSHQQQQIPIPIHPLTQNNHVVTPSISTTGATSNLNANTTSSAPNLSSTSSSRGLHNTLVPPEPTFIDEPSGDRYGIRCVCKKGVPDGFLIQCDKCNFWLHGRCVCIARSTKDSYICPFCSGQVIRCKCNNNMLYDIPIVQCQRCKLYVHKTCEDLMFGIVPQNFICHRCGGREYLLPKIVLKDNLLPNRTSFIECNRFEVMQSIPEGKFRNMVLSDLAKTELSLHETIGRYFQEFATIFFEFNHEFWKTFVDIFTQILMCDKSMVMLAIDAFAYSLLYKTVPRPHYSNHLTKFGISETMQTVLNSLNAKRIEKPPTPVPLYVDQDGHVRTSQTLDDEQFIVDLPGFLMFADELNADDGIPPTCFAITDTEYVIDLEGSSFNLAHQFQRSFHFNTVVRIYRLGDDPRVGLFATRLKGPISEEKGKRGPAVQHDMPLILPFDGEIPFNTPKVEWKERKTKARAAAKAKNSAAGNGNSSNSNTNSRRSSTYSSRSHGNGSYSNSSRRRSNADTSSASPCNFSLSLLTAFCEDIIPPIPITLLTEKEFAERNKQAEHPKTRARNHKIRNASDDD